LVVGRGGDFVVDLVDGFGAPADRVGGRRDVDAHGVADRLAHVEGFQQRQFFLVQDQIGEADQDALALGRGQLAQTPDSNDGVRRATAALASASSVLATLARNGRRPG
jgi:hypothetical protein